jgi:hypothetical protein
MGPAVFVPILNSGTYSTLVLKVWYLTVITYNKS